MYLRRKVDEWLIDWKKRKDKFPALIVGIRQCGKTKSIENFAINNYKNMVKLNFWDNPEYCLDFDGSLDVDTIISHISLRFPDKKIYPHDTLIFFDEIQECPRARLALKNIALDGRFDVVCSGSYLGINGYIIGDTTPAPTGYDEVFEMHTMDFEDFLWANNYTDEQIDELEYLFVNRKPIPDAMHSVFKEIFLKYACIGGFPRAVQEYIYTHNIMDAVRIVKNTIFDMRTDFGRRKDKEGHPLFKASEVARIQEVFDLIPTFLSKENKRFIVSKISTGSQRDKGTAIEYLKQAHIVYKVHNLENPSLPLIVNRIQTQYK